MFFTFQQTSNLVNFYKPFFLNSFYNYQPYPPLRFKPFISISAIFNSLSLDFPPILSPALKSEKKKKLKIPKNFINFFFIKGLSLRISRLFMRAIFTFLMWRKTNVPFSQFLLPSKINYLQTYFHSRKLFIFSELFDSLLIPSFSFYFLRIEKNIRKFSRGKSGKYKLKWFFVPPFKRLALLVHLISTEVRASSVIGLYRRFFITLENLFFKFTNLTYFKTYKFVYYYIFKNFRNAIIKQSNFKYTKSLVDLKATKTKSKIK